MAVYTLYQITQHSLLILFLMTHIDTIPKKIWFVRGSLLRFVLFLKNNVCVGFHTQRRTHINTYAHYLKYTLRISTCYQSLYTRTQHIDTYIRHQQIRHYTRVYTSIYNTRRRTQSTHQNTRTLDIHIHYPYIHTHSI